VAQQVKQLAPDNSTVDDTIGWAYYRKGFYPTALKYLEVAVARDSTAVHQYHFAMACFQVGSRNRGMQAYSLALKLDPKLPEAKMTEAVLLKQHP
jgi:tetratricopeptide (TPR) repeat protein